ncbi:unnamed protein product [Coccothraustes coccothraustes]
MRFVSEVSGCPRPGLGGAPRAEFAARPLLRAAPATPAEAWKCRCGYLRLGIGGPLAARVCLAGAIPSRSSRPPRCCSRGKRRPGARVTEPQPGPVCGSSCGLFVPHHSCSGLILACSCACVPRDQLQFQSGFAVQQ